LKVYICGEKDNENERKAFDLFQAKSSYTD